jgi:hypothetical protein
LCVVCYRSAGSHWPKSPHYAHRIALCVMRQLWCCSFWIGGERVDRPLRNLSFDCCTKTYNGQHTYEFAADARPGLVPGDWWPDKEYRRTRCTAGRAASKQGGGREGRRLRAGGSGVPVRSAQRTASHWGRKRLGSVNVWVGKRSRATKKRRACHEVRRDGPGGDGTDMMQKQK